RQVIDNRNPADRRGVAVPNWRIPSVKPPVWIDPGLQMSFEFGGITVQSAQESRLEAFEGRPAENIFDPAASDLLDVLGGATDQARVSRIHPYVLHLPVALSYTDGHGVRHDFQSLPGLIACAGR